MRSANVSNTNNVDNINTSGASNNNNASNAYALLPDNASHMREVSTPRRLSETAKANATHWEPSRLSAVFRSGEPAP